VKRALLTLAVAASAAALPAVSLAADHADMPTTGPIRTGPSITYDAPAVNRVRQSVTSLNQDQKDRLVQAILLLKATPSPWDSRFSWYDNFVWWHRKAFACEVDQAHMRPAFLPWHRQFIFMFESALRVVSHDDTITLPYWDWTDPAARKVIFSNAFMGPNGSASHHWAVVSGPFRAGRWHLNVRDPKANDPLRTTYLSRHFASWPKQTGLPTVAQVNAALAAPSYDVAPYGPSSNVKTSFRNNIEGWRGFSGMKCTSGFMVPVRVKGNTQPNRLHNSVHLWVGGAIGPKKAGGGGTMDLSTSPNDPTFWLHHANIDRLWSKWETTHGERYAPLHSSIPGQGLNSAMWPWRQSGLFVSPKSVLNISAMGYAYEDTPAAKG